MAQAYAESSAQEIGPFRFCLLKPFKVIKSNTGLTHSYDILLEISSNYGYILYCFLDNLQHLLKQTYIILNVPFDM